MTKTKNTLSKKRKKFQKKYIKQILLDKNISVFIPYEGEGLLVRAKDIDYL